MAGRDQQGRIAPAQLGKIRVLAEPNPRRVALVFAEDPRSSRIEARKVEEAQGTTAGEVTIILASYGACPDIPIRHVAAWVSGNRMVEAINPVQPSLVGEDVAVGINDRVTPHPPLPELEEPTLQGGGAGSQETQVVDPGPEHMGVVRIQTVQR